MVTAAVTDTVVAAFGLVIPCLKVVDAFERVLGVRMRRLVVPRPVLAFGARALRRRRPEFASILGIALSMDVGEEVGAEGLRTLGIEPRPASAHIAARARAVART